MSGPSPAMDPWFRGQPVVVTGATGGIGLWTALGLARGGAEVTLVGRSQERLAHAAAWIAETARVAAPATERADFASLAEVAALGERLAARLPRVAVLVNNAGMVSTKRRLSRDGYELTFAVNHLAAFLLTRELLPRLHAAPSARIITVASVAHESGRIAWDDLLATRGYAAMRAYSQSKLANILFTAELARRLAGSSVIANSVHPGVVGSGFGAVGGVFGFGWSLLRPFLLSPEKGADTSLYVASAPELEGVSGHYFARRRAVTPSAAARDMAAASRLWRISDEMVDRALAARALATGAPAKRTPS